MRFQTVETTHTGTSIADTLPIYSGVDAQETHGREDVLLERTVADSRAVPVSSEVEGQDHEALAACLQAEVRMPGSPTAGSVTHDEPGRECVCALECGRPVIRLKPVLGFVEQSGELQIGSHPRLSGREQAYGDAVREGAHSE